MSIANSKIFRVVLCLVLLLFVGFNSFVRAEAVVIAATITTTQLILALLAVCGVTFAVAYQDEISDAVNVAVANFETKIRIDYPEMYRQIVEIKNGYNNSAPPTVGVAVSLLLLEAFAEIAQSEYGTESGAFTPDGMGYSKVYSEPFTGSDLVLIPPGSYAYIREGETAVLNSYYELISGTGRITRFRTVSVGYDDTTVSLLYQDETNNQVSVFRTVTTTPVYEQFNGELCRRISINGSDTAIATKINFVFSGSQPACNIGWGGFGDAEFVTAYWSLTGCTVPGVTATTIQELPYFIIPEFTQAQIEEASHAGGYTDDDNVPYVPIFPVQGVPGSQTEVLAPDINEWLETNYPPDPGGDPTDPPGGVGSTTNQTINNFRAPALILQKFPFCIPYDLFMCFEMMVAEPAVPEFTIPFNYSNSTLGIYVDEEIVVSLEDFETVATISRWFLLAIFLLGLVLVTRQLIRG